MPKTMLELPSDFDNWEELMYFNSKDDFDQNLVFLNSKNEVQQISKKNSKIYVNRIIKSKIALTPQFINRVFNSYDLSETNKGLILKRSITKQHPGSTLLLPNKRKFYERLDEINFPYFGSGKSEKEIEEFHSSSLASIENYKEQRDSGQEPEQVLEEDDIKELVPQKEQFKTPVKTPKTPKTPGTEAFHTPMSMPTPKSSEEALVLALQTSEKLAELEGEDDSIDKELEIEEEKARKKALDETYTKLKQKEEFADEQKYLNEKYTKIINILKNPSLTRQEAFEKVAETNSIPDIPDFEELLDKFKPPGYTPPEPEQVEDPEQEQEPEQKENVSTEAEPAQFANVVKQETKVKYHKVPILLMYGNDERPDWDLELESVINKSDFDASFLKTACSDIQKNYGSQIFVYKVEQGDKQEFLELIQLMYSFERGLMKGSRSKSALVKIKDLTNFSNTLLGTENETEETEEAEETEETKGRSSEKTVESDIIPLDQVENALKNTPNYSKSQAVESFTQVAPNKVNEQLDNAINQQLKKYTIMGVPLNLVSFRKIPPNKI